MGRLWSFRSGLGGLGDKRRVDRELDEELTGFLEDSVAEKVRRGMDAREARRVAMAEMGSANVVKHKVWSSRWESWVDGRMQDLRLAVRGLVKTPGFTTVALLSLGLGIGANTAIFSLMRAAMLRPLPVARPGELVLFGNGTSRGLTYSLPSGRTRLFSYPFYREMSSRADVFSGVAVVNSNRYEPRVSVAGGAPEKVELEMVSGSYFSVLGTGPMVGRVLMESDDQADDAAPIAVISYAYFQRRLQGNQAAIGKVIRIGKTDYTIVGVARPGFTGITVGSPAELWVPLSMEKEIAPERNGRHDKFFQSLFLFGRLKPGVTMERAQGVVNGLFQQILHAEYVDNPPSKKQLNSIQHAEINLTSLANGISPLSFEFGLPLKILMGIVGLVLLIACANLANMLLARGVARAREVAVRMALGASRGRIVTQLVTESALLALTGACLGVALAWLVTPVMLHMATPGPTPMPLDVRPDMTVLGFTLVVAVLTAMLSGVAPALRATKLELTPTLKEGRGLSAPTRGIAARGMIAGQIALSILLLTVAGLFLRSLMKLNSVEMGFDPKQVLLFGIDGSAANLPAEVQTPTELRIEEGVQAIPGVMSASFAMQTYHQGSWTDRALFQGTTRTPENGDEVVFNIAGTEFFKTMGIPLVAGRGFTTQDVKGAPKIAVINETMQRLFFPTGSAIGRHFGFGDDPAKSGEIEVVGVVKDAKQFSPGDPPMMGAYFPMAQSPGFYGSLVVRYAGDPESVVASVRKVVAGVNSNIAVDSATTMEAQVAGSVATATLVAQLSVFFGLLAVGLACIGIYGLMAYSVARRTNEIGIRLALGARTGRVLWMVLRESLVLLAIGVAAGVPVALASTGVLRTLLYQLSPTDAGTLAGAAVAVGLMTVLAAWLPARRAAKVDPMVALRCE